MARNCPLCGAGLYTQTVSGDLCFVCSGCAKQFRPKKPTTSTTQPSAATPAPQMLQPTQQAPKVVSAALSGNVGESKDADQANLKLPPPFVPEQNMPQRYGSLSDFISPSRLSILLLLVITLSIFVDIAKIWSKNSLINFISNRNFYRNIDEFSEVLYLDRVILWIRIGLVITLCIIFLMWVYRVNSNLSPLKATQIRFSPGWAILWFFIPIFNIWKPCQVIVDVWKGSNDKTLGKSASTNSFLIVFWWIAQISCQAFSYLLRLLHVKLLPYITDNKQWTMKDEYTFAKIHNVVPLAFSIMASLLMILVVFTIWKRQEARHEAIRAQDQHAAGSAV